MIYISSPEVISTGRPHRETCTETAFAEGTKPVTTVSDQDPNSSRWGLTEKEDIDLYLNYRSISHSLTTHSHKHNNKERKKEKATANATAAWLVDVPPVLNPSAVASGLGSLLSRTVTR